MSEQAVLQIQNLTKEFGGITAVSDITLTLPEKTIMGIIGPNGAGKTTIFNLITGVYHPTMGTVLFQGNDITHYKPDSIVKQGISRTFQNIRLFKKLTVLDNVVTALDLNYPKYNVWQAMFCNVPFYNSKVKQGEKQLREMAKEFLALVGIEDLAYKQADSLPYGLQRKLEIARALALKPSLLLLDEPAAGMNPEETRALGELVREIQQKLQLTVLLIEHHMDLVMELCDDLYVINFGKQLAQGTPEEIQSNPAVLEAYLGGDANA